MWFLWKGSWTPFPKGGATHRLRSPDTETAKRLCISACSLLWEMQDLSLSLHCFTWEGEALFLSFDSNTHHKYPVLASFFVKGECLKPLLTSGIFEEMRKLRVEGGLALSTLTCGMTQQLNKKKNIKIKNSSSWNLEVLWDYKVNTHQGTKNKSAESLEIFWEHLRVRAC